MSPVLAVWIAINAATLALTLIAAREAYRDRRAVAELNGHARVVAVNGAVVRERIRVSIQLLLLSVAVPPLLAGRNVELTWGVAMLMAVPLLLFLESFVDYRTRREVAGLVRAEG